VDVLPPFGAAGIAVLLAIVIGYLLNANRADRKEHRAERIEWDARFKAKREAHAAELKELKATYAADLKDLRDRVERLEQRLHDETLRADRAEARLTALTGGTGA
jgi:Skp family chaperone for outer membrane proteins